MEESVSLSYITHIRAQVQTSRSSHRPPLRHLDVWDRQLHMLTETHTALCRGCQSEYVSVVDDPTSGDLPNAAPQKCRHMVNCVHTFFVTEFQYLGPFSTHSRKVGAWRIAVHQTGWGMLERGFSPERDPSQDLESGLRKRRGCMDELHLW